MGEGNRSLFDKGLSQGGVFRCSCSELRAAIQEGRAIPKYRRRPVDGQNEFLVLSQDCDILQPNDPYIEIVQITRPKRAEPGLVGARDYKKLHFLCDGDPRECRVEFISTVEKRLLEEKSLEVIGKLDGSALEAIKDWRVGRYSRNPFPDAFNQAFIQNYLKAPGNSLAQFLAENSDKIIDLFVYVDPEHDDNAASYRVSITALVNEDVASEAEIRSISDVMRSHVQELHEADNCLEMIQVAPELLPEDKDVNLEFASSKIDMSFRDAEISRRLPIDYLCYSEDAAAVCDSRRKS